VKQIADQRPDQEVAIPPPGLATFVAANGQRLLQFAFLLTGGDGPAAEDLLYGVLGRLVVSGIDTLRDPLPYVRRSMINELHSQERRSNRQQRSVRLLAADRKPDPHSEPEDRLVIMKALRDLGARERAAILLRYYEDLPDDHIAAILGCSRSTVRSLIYRAMPKLRALLIEPDEGHRNER
jgi:RNA polymerase sigma factor (sigma-70 family)